MGRHPNRRGDRRRHSAEFGLFFREFVDEQPSDQLGPPASGPVPGVVECAVSYDTLYVRPASITLTCGDGQAGVENMTWTTWSASTATGKGDYFEDPCVPNCADGGRETYPVQVMLSGVKTSPDGTYFSELTITWWEGNVPPNPPAGSFRLMAPTAQP